MSRGPGAVQRAITAALESWPREHTTVSSYPLTAEHRHRYPAWRTVHDLAGDVFRSGDPTRVQVESVRRAAKRLAAEGLAQLAEKRWTRRRNGPRGPVDAERWMLSVRPVLTSAEREAERAEENERARRIAALIAETGAAGGPVPVMACSRCGTRFTDRTALVYRDVHGWSCRDEDACRRVVLEKVQQRSAIGRKRTGRLCG